MSLIETTSDFRFGIGGEDTLCSLSFKVQRSGKEIYVLCRELTQLKHSFHSSGIHRYALIQDGPREAFDSSRLPRLADGRFITIMRIIFTTERAWDYNIKITPKRFVLIPPAEQGKIGVVSLGLTPHHPRDHPSTNLRNHFAILKISEKKYLTASFEALPANFILNQFSLHNAIHPGSDAITGTHPYFVDYDDNSVPFWHDNYLMHFQTKLRTFFFWAHHNVIPEDNMFAWANRHPFAKAIFENRERATPPPPLSMIGKPTILVAPPER